MFVSENVRGVLVHEGGKSRGKWNNEDVSGGLKRDKEGMTRRKKGIRWERERERNIYLQLHLLI